MECIKHYVLACRCSYIRNEYAFNWIGERGEFQQNKQSYYYYIDAFIYIETMHWLYLLVVFITQWFCSMQFYIGVVVVVVVAIFCCFSFSFFCRWFERPLSFSFYMLRFFFISMFIFCCCFDFLKWWTQYVRCCCCYCVCLSFFYFTFV